MDHKDKYYNVEDIKKYIDIQMVHVEFDYTNGKKKKKRYSTVKDCTEKDFKKDFDQLRYFNSTKEEKEKLICMNQEVLDWNIKGNI